MAGSAANFRVIEITAGLTCKSASGVTVNNANDVLLGAIKDRVMCGYIWQSGKLQEIPYDTAGYNFWPGAFNEHRQVAGSTGPGYEEQRAFLWEKGKLRALPDFGSTFGSYAEGLNDSGSVVGTGFLKDGGSRGVLWRDGKIAETGERISSDSTEFTAINNRGDIAGYVETAGMWRAFLWSGNSVEYLPIKLWSHISHLSDKGYAAGFVSETPDRQIGFVYANKKIIKLGTLGGKVSYAECVNDSMVVVGNSYFGRGVDTHAFVWKDGRMYDLNALINRKDIVLTSAQSINKHGHILCNGVSNKVPKVYLLMDQAGG